MKILLIYYTGTYNTRFVTNALKDRLIRSNFEVTTIEVNKDTKPINLNTFDIIGLGYPIYAFNSPLIFNKYIRKINLLKEKKYFIYKDSGETLPLNDASSRVIKRILKHNKCQLIDEYHMVMPYNIHFKFDDAFVKEILNYLDKQIEIINYDLIHGKRTIINPTKYENFVSSLYGIQKIGGFVNSFFYRIDYSKCSHCGLCVNECPVHNIKLKKNNKYHFGHACQMCMRCSFYCPENAIKIGIYDKWRVNGDYHFNRIKNDDNLKLPYIVPSSGGFYECFIKSFNAIDKRYEEIKK